MNAICYHNNPETLKEAFKHSIRVGKSFAENPNQIIEYGKKYIKVIVILFVALVISIILLYRIDFKFTNILLSLLVLLFLLLEYIALKRIIKEKKIEYLYSVPILSINR
jgi:hypothetical protein